MKKLVLIALAVLSLSANAAFMDGNNLQQLAIAADRMDNGNASETEGLQAVQYIGYVMGVMDSHNGISFCAPRGVSARQAAAMVKKWLDANPEKWTLPGQTVVTNALSSAFPCAK